MKDHDVDILYHLRKVNVVVDALSRKSMCSLVHMRTEKKELIREIYQLINLGSD